MLFPHSPSPVGSDETPSDTRLSNSSKVSPEIDRSRTVTVAGPENVHGGASASAASGFVVAVHPPKQPVAAPPALNRNWSQLPSGVIVVAEADLADRASRTNPRTKNLIFMMASTWAGSRPFRGLNESGDAEQVSRRVAYVGRRFCAGRRRIGRAVT